MTNFILSTIILLNTLLNSIDQLFTRVEVVRTASD